MREREAAMLIGNGVIERAVFYRAISGGWELHLYGEQLPAIVRNPMERSKGDGTQAWPTLDDAFGYLKGLCNGRKVSMEIDG